MSENIFPGKAVHLDFHTMPAIYDVGSEFNSDEFGTTLKNANIEHVNVFAKCNLGFAYYPTKIGTMHPGLKIDLLGQMLESCHNQGIKVSAYFHIALDHEHALRHRDWCKVDKQGRVCNYEEMGHYFRTMCLNTAYRQYLLSMISEILDKYPVDGVFLDCFNMLPCYGAECLDEMRQLGMDVFDDTQVGNFCYDMTTRFVEEAQNLIESYSKSAFVCFNGMPYKKQPSYIMVADSGYDSLPFAIRYARTLDKPCVTLTGRFHRDWGDFGGIRSKHSLLFDCYNSIANGGTCCIGDHVYPRAKLEPEVYKLIGNTYESIKALEPWTKSAKALTDVAVLYPSIADFPAYKSTESAMGASRMLSELKQQFNVCDGSSDLSKYNLLILPDNVCISDELKLKLQEYLANGKSIICSAFSGMDISNETFVLDDYPVKYEGKEPYDPTYFSAMPKIADDIPNMPNAIYDAGIAMTAVDGAEILAKLYKPYFNLRSWDYNHENMYTPPEKDSGRPAVVCKGNIIHISFPIFSSYFKNVPIVYKTLMANCINLLMNKPLIKVKGLPSFGQITVLKAHNSKLVNVLTYVPELRGNKQIIEEPIMVYNAEIALRVDDTQISNVYLAPSMEKLDFGIEDGYVIFKVSEINGFQMVVIE